MPPRLPGLPTFAALLLSVLITIWLGLWGPFFSIELKSLNDSPGFAAWAQAVVAGVAMLVVYISATMPMRTEAAERATERRVRAEGLALLLFSEGQPSN